MSNEHTSKKSPSFEINANVERRVTERGERINAHGSVTIVDEEVLVGNCAIDGTRRLMTSMVGRLPRN